MSTQISSTKGTFLALQEVLTGSCGSTSYASFGSQIFSPSFNNSRSFLIRSQSLRCHSFSRWWTYIHSSILMRIGENLCGEAWSQLNQSKFLILTSLKQWEQFLHRFLHRWAKQMRLYRDRASMNRLQGNTAKLSNHRSRDTPWMCHLSRQDRLHKKTT